MTARQRERERERERERLQQQNKTTTNRTRKQTCIPVCCLSHLGRQVCHASPNINQHYRSHNVDVHLCVSVYVCDKQWITPPTPDITTNQVTLNRYHGNNPPGLPVYTRMHTLQPLFYNFCFV